MSPALQDLSSGAVYTLGNGTAFLVGRSPTADLPLTDPRCSRSQFLILRSGREFKLEALSLNVPTYCNDRAVTAPVRLIDGAVIRAGSRQFRFVLDVSPLSSVPAEDAPSNILVAGTLSIGRDRSAGVALPHPQVSRRHAVLTAVGGRAELRDLGSANGTFVNGRKLAPGEAVRLAAGDRVAIGPFDFRFDGKRLNARSRANNIELVARDVSRVVTDRQTGRPLTLLDGVSIVIRPREFVCLLGPSGSGKSTLMGVMSGRTHPDSGAVEVNGQDLHARFDALKQDIALVPQKDLLHDTLSVGQVLRYTARLRLPPDTTAAEADNCVDEILSTVQLAARRGTLVRHLSGGQLKRASLANEILVKPSLLFLDEVTSGLDEQTDRDMMHLFRSLADAGKTVVCVTHSLANVERTCNLVVVLTPGGKLAFVGTPEEALRYFEIDRLGDVYARLADRPAEEWQKAFLNSPYYQKYVTSRLPAEADEPAPAPVRGPASEKRRLFARQAWLLSGRYLAVWRGAPDAVLAMLGQPLLVAVLLGLVFGSLRDVADPQTKAARVENLLFLLAVTSFWFGCNNAAKELVKERGIFTRERDFSLLTESYYLSKLGVLCGFGFAQIIVLYGVVKGWCGPPGPWFGEAIILFALVAAGTALGLLISALAPTEEVAVTLIPVAVIPQVILSGGIAPLSGAAKYLSMAAITTYWGKRGLDSLLPDDLAGIAQNLELAESGSPWLALAAVLAHGTGYLVVGLFILKVQGRAAARLVSRLKNVMRQPANANA